MNVTMIIPTAFPGTRGSPARAYEMCRALSAKGVNVDIVCYNEGAGKPIPDGVEVYRIPKLPFYKKGIGPSYSRIILDIFLLFKALINAFKRKPDVLHCHLHEGALIGLIVSMFFSIPVVFDIHSSLESELAGWNFADSNRRRIVKKFAGYLDRNIPKWVDYSVVLSERQLNSYKQIYSELKIEKISNPTDLTHFTPKESNLRKQLNLENDVVVGYQGNMTGLQNLALFVEIAECMVKTEPDIKFLIGYTSDPEETIKNVRDKNLDKYFIFVPAPYDNAPDVINCCDIMIIPRTETSAAPMKLTNFMACGKPVVLHSDFVKGITNEEHELGLFGFNNKEDLMDALLKLIRNKELRAESRDAMVNFVKKEFSHDSLYERLKVIYSKIV